MAERRERERWGVEMKMMGAKCQVSTAPLSFGCLTLSPLMPSVRLVAELGQARLLVAARARKVEEAVEDSEAAKCLVAHEIESLEEGMRLVKQDLGEAKAQVRERVKWNYKCACESPRLEQSRLCVSQCCMRSFTWPRPSLSSTYTRRGLHNKERPRPPSLPQPSSSRCAQPSLASIPAPCLDCCLPPFLPSSLSSPL